jgi:3-deoxy-D-manno-octulosonate 8-phosphate phosphatase (KDO 8-P phosphatase)
MEENYKTLLRNVKAFAFDVDGVMTDGTLVVFPDGLHRIMNIRDGYALHEAVKAGYPIFVVSGGHSEGVHNRLSKLGIREVHLGITDKTATMNRLLESYGIDWNSVAYMGDDLPDFDVIRHAGLRACPQDAVHEIKSLCQYVSPIAGGRGCVRDLIEQVMKVQGKWPHQFSSPSAD